MSDHTHEGKHEEKFSTWLFIFTILLSLAALFGVLAFIAPGVWATQLAAGWLSFVVVFASIHAVAGVFEYFFHRYILHAR